jgi:hypothetical protein
MRCELLARKTSTTINGTTSPAIGGVIYGGGGGHANADAAGSADVDDIIWQGDDGRRWATMRTTRDMASIARATRKENSPGGGCWIPPGRGVRRSGSRVARGAQDGRTARPVINAARVRLDLVSSCHRRRMRGPRGGVGVRAVGMALSPGTRASTLLEALTQTSPARRAVDWSKHRAIDQDGFPGHGRSGVFNTIKSAGRTGTGVTQTGHVSHMRTIKTIRASHIGTPVTVLRGLRFPRGGVYSNVTSPQISFDDDDRSIPHDSCSCHCPEPGGCKGGGIGAR